MRSFLLFLGLLTCLSSQALEVGLQRADEIARETAAWFTYTTGPMVTDHQGQCGDWRRQCGSHLFCTLARQISIAVGIGPIIANA
jgi:hypothetical protein